MDYSSIYQNLISKAKDRVFKGYVEKHHIIPKCMGGNNLPENIVALTPEEHYLAHQLLVKIYPGKGKLIFALRMMCAGGKNHNRNNKEYGWIKRKVAKESSESQKGKSYGHKFKKGHTHSKGEKNGMMGKNHTEETKSKMSEAASNRSPEVLKTMSEAAKTRTYSEEGLKMLSIRSQGEGNVMWGKNHTEETKSKMSESAKSKPRKTCKYCSKNITTSMHTRWHGDNCKLKP